MYTIGQTVWVICSSGNLHEPRCYVIDSGPTELEPGLQCWTARGESGSITLYSDDEHCSTELEAYCDWKDELSCQLCELEDEFEREVSHLREDIKLANKMIKSLEVDS